MSALCVNGCGRPRDVDATTGTVYLECWPCIMGHVESPRYRVADPIMERAEDLWYIRPGEPTRPAPKDATREAA